MGSGKTTIGKRIAEPIGFDFVDTDHYIEQQQGMTVAQIFSTLGEDAFRTMEHNVLTGLRQRDFLVVSTGGGMPCHKNNMDLMLSDGKVVYLKTSPQTLTKRLIRSKTERPLIREKSENEMRRYIEEMLAGRELFYNRAHITVQTETFSLPQLLQSLHLMKQ